MPLSLGQGLTLYFARHGQTEANLAKRYSGKKDTPLTALGRQQAEEIGLVLKRELGPRPAIACVSSPLARARATMEIARGVLELPPQGYAIDPRLQEIDLGQWDQLTEAEARALDPAYYQRRAQDKWTVPALGGEDYAQVAARLTDWVKDLETDTFAVSHGAATRILRGLFCGLDAARMSALPEPRAWSFGCGAAKSCNCWAPEARFPIRVPWGKRERPGTRAIATCLPARPNKESHVP